MCQLGQVPAHQLQLGLLRKSVLPPAITQAGALQTVQSGAPLGQVGVATHGDGVEVSALFCLLWGCLSPALHSPRWFRGSSCHAVTCTGRGSHRKDSGGPGNLVVVSVQGRRRGGGAGPTGCTGPAFPRSTPESSDLRPCNRSGWTGPRASCPVTARGFISPKLCGDHREAHQGPR